MQGIPDPLDRTLGIDPLENIEKVEVLPRADKDDYETARDGIHRMLGVTETAINELAAIARLSQHARAYEVLSNLIKTAVESHTDLVNLAQKNKVLLGDSRQTGQLDGPRTVNNTLIVTSAELLDMVKDKTREIQGEAQASS